MKRVRCPKCDAFTMFDETRFEAGRKLIFQCSKCGKQFAIRLGTLNTASTETMQEPQKTSRINEDWGSVVVLDNAFGYRQEFPLREGDNAIGRRCTGTQLEVPIETSDMSMDRRHCILHVVRGRQNQVVYTLRDGPSLTGTFVDNTLLADRERLVIYPGAVVSIGAATLLLRGPVSDEGK